MGSPIVFFQLGTNDPEHSAAFFRELFGWDIGPGSPGIAASIETHDPGDIAVNGGFVQVPDGTQPYVSIFVRVEDLDATLAKAPALGAHVLVARTQTPGGVDIAIIRAPEGHIIGLVQQ